MAIPSGPCNLIYNDIGPPFWRLLQRKAPATKGRCASCELIKNESSKRGREASNLYTFIIDILMKRVMEQRGIVPTIGAEREEC